MTMNVYYNIVDYLYKRIGPNEIYAMHANVVLSICKDFHINSSMHCIRTHVLITHCANYMGPDHYLLSIECDKSQALNLGKETF